MTRVELNEHDMEQVVGGAFQFYNEGNEGFCIVSDVSRPGEYHCLTTGVYSFMQMRAENPGLSADEYLDMALEKGILW